MKRILLVTVMVCFFACHVHIVQAQEILFQETFGRLNSPEGQWADLDVSQLDHPSGWDFDRVHAGPQCLVVEEGGSFTLPAIPQMMGNASIYISVFPWQDDDFTPCKLSVSEGEVEKTDVGVAVSIAAEIALYDVTPASRITFTATHAVKVDQVVVRYGAPGSACGFEVSAESGQYIEPMEVQITPKGYAYGEDYTADHIILVYTTDGTEPTPFSPRYDGPIAVDTTTTLRVGCISPYGTMVKRDYTYLYPVDVRNMADYRALPDNTFARLQLDDAVVTYSEITAGKGGDWYQYIYLRDSTGAIGTEGYGSLPLHTGDVLGGSVVLYSRRDGGWSMSEYSSFDNLATDYREPEPIVVESVSELLDSCWLCQLVTLSGVTVSDGYAHRDGASILLDKVSTMRTLFPSGTNTAENPEAEYDITGIVQPVYGGGFQLMAIDYPVLTGIGGVAADGAVPVAYYQPDGRRVERPERGIYLVRYSDGTVRKVFFR